MQKYLIHGVMMLGMQVSTVYAQVIPRTMAEKLQLAEKLRLMDSFDANPSGEEVRMLLEFCGNETGLPDPPGVSAKPVTVADTAASRLAAISGQPRTAAIALDFLESNEVSAAQFSAILRAFRLYAIDDRTAARLQNVAAHGGVEFNRAILDRIRLSPQKFDERFDLVISELLHHDAAESVARACGAISNRKSRVLNWNSRLVDLCESPLTGDLRISDDIAILEYDFRNWVMRALRVNGFPDKRVSEFLREFRPEPDSELYWQHKATAYTLLGDPEPLDDFILALRSDRSREHASKVLLEDLRIPERYKIEVLDAAVVRDDRVGARLGDYFIHNFCASGISGEDLARLERVLARSSKQRFESWKAQETGLTSGSTDECVHNCSKNKDR